MSDSRVDVPASLVSAASCIAAERGLAVSEPVLVTALSAAASRWGSEMVDLREVVLGIARSYLSVASMDDADVTVDVPATLVVEVVSLLNSVPSGLGVDAGGSAGAWSRAMLASWRDRPPSGLRRMLMVDAPVGMRRAREMLRADPDTAWAAGVREEPAIPVPLAAFVKAVGVLNLVGGLVPGEQWRQWLDAAGELEGMVDLDG